MTTYLVAGWEDLYENNRSRSVSTLTWVPIPNKHDGERFSMLIGRPDAPIIFTAWILILQVASRCNPRGSLVRGDGTPYDAASLALRTRGQTAWFDAALPYLVKIGWLVCDRQQQQELTFTVSPTVSQSVSPTALNGMEGKGMEGKKQAHFAPPFVEDWLAYGKTFEPTWPENDARGTWDFYEANGWCQGRGKKIRNWQAALRTCVSRWRERKTSWPNQRQSVMR